MPDQKQTREELLERMLKGYQAYFDIERYEEREDALPLMAHCRFYVHSEKYVLVKKAQLWDADSPRIPLYFFCAGADRGNLPYRCKDCAYEEGMKLIESEAGAYVHLSLPPVYYLRHAARKRHRARIEDGAAFTKVFIFRCMDGWTSIPQWSTGTGQIVMTTNRERTRQRRNFEKILYS